MSTADATPAQDVASNADWFPISSLHPVLGHIVDLWDASERCRYADCFFDTGLGGWVREATDDNGWFCLIEVKGATHWAYAPKGPPQPVVQQSSARPVRSGELMSQSAQIPDLDKLPPCALLTYTQVAKLAGYSLVTIKRWAADGRGPRMTRIEGRPRFAVRDVKAWLGGESE